MTPAKEPHSVRLLETFAEPFQRAQAAGSLRPDRTLDDVFLVVKMVDGTLRHDPDDAATAAKARSPARAGAPPAGGHA